MVFTAFVLDDHFPGAGEQRAAADSSETLDSTRYVRLSKRCIAGEIFVHAQMITILI
jgi:hypothetical protein